MTSPPPSEGEAMLKLADEEALADFIYEVQDYGTAKEKAKLLWPVIRAAAQSSGVRAWQPIESAPRDGSAFLGLNVRASAGYRVVYFDDEAIGPYFWHVEDAAKGFNHHLDFLTHWMPLPERPALSPDTPREGNYDAHRERLFKAAGAVESPREGER